MTTSKFTNHSEVENDIEQTRFTQDQKEAIQTILKTKGKMTHLDDTIAMFRKACFALERSKQSADKGLDKTARTYTQQQRELNKLLTSLKKAQEALEKLPPSLAAMIKHHLAIELNSPRENPASLIGAIAAATQTAMEDIPEIKKGKATSDTYTFGLSILADEFPKIFKNNPVSAQEGSLFYELALCWINHFTELEISDPSRKIRQILERQKTAGTQEQ